MKIKRLSGLGLALATVALGAPAAAQAKTTLFGTMVNHAACVATATALNNAAAQTGVTGAVFTCRGRRVNVTTQDRPGAAGGADDAEAGEPADDGADIVDTPTAMDEG